MHLLELCCGSSGCGGNLAALHITSVLLRQLSVSAQCQFCTVVVKMCIRASTSPIPLQSECSRASSRAGAFRLFQPHRHDNFMNQVGGGLGSAESRTVSPTRCERTGSAAEFRTEKSFRLQKLVFYTSCCYNLNVDVMVTYSG